MDFFADRVGVPVARHLFLVEARLDLDISDGSNGEPPGVIDGAVRIVQFGRVPLRDRLRASIKVEREVPVEMLRPLNHPVERDVIRIGDFGVPLSSSM